MLHSRERLFQFISPLSVLMGLMRLRPLYEKHYSDGVIVSEIGLDRTSGSPSDEDLERLNRDAPLIRRQLEDDPDFRRAMERLNAAGVRYEFGGQGDACGQFTVLRFKAKATSFPALEALAAEDAGIVDPAERQAAADRFRILCAEEPRRQLAVQPREISGCWRMSVFRPCVLAQGHVSD